MKACLVASFVLCLPTFTARADPSLAFVSFVGDTQKSLIAHDASGNIYIGGNVTSNAVPATPGAFQASYRGGICQRGLLPGGPCSDVYVAKWDPSGTRMLWATYLGGTGDDFLNGMAVDTDGNVYLDGATSSADFPVTQGAFQTHYNLSVSVSGYTVLGDAFVAKLNSSGNALLFATYLGGKSSDSAGAIAVDSAGNVYVAGATYSTDFPVTPGALQTVNYAYSPSGGGATAFIAKLNPAGSALIYATYLGGSGGDDALAIAVDAAGVVSVVGVTHSVDFPVTPGSAFQTSLADAGGLYLGDAFLARIGPAGTVLLSATYFGGAGADVADAIALDAAGTIYVAGSTTSADLPTTADALPRNSCAQTGQTPLLCGGGFVARFDPSGAKLVYATHLGGSGSDRIESMAVDRQGSVYVAGSTGSMDFPVTADAFQPCSRSIGMAGSGFVAKFQPGSPLTYSTFLGGVGGAEVTGLFVDDSGRIYVVGNASQATVPVAGTAEFTHVPDFPPAPVPVLELGAIEGGGTFLGMIDPATAAPPNRISCIVNDADQRGGYLSPGEIVAIQGRGLGPEQPAPAQLTSFGTVSTSVAGVQVSFAGIAAPLLSVQADRIVAIVPASVAFWAQADVQVLNSGIVTAAFPAVLSRATPAAFTQDGSGHGPAAVLNQDGTVNSPANPAAKGSVIAIYGTGLGGQGNDGTFNSGKLPAPGGNVGVSIGGYAADVVFSGGAPGEVFGVYQVNVRVPPQAPAGPADSLYLYLDIANFYGTSAGPAGPTISVR